MKHPSPWFLATLIVLGGGCEGPRRSGSFWRGDRQQSASLRASSARPTPGDDVSHPLAPDRFGIDQAMARRRGEHEHEHTAGSLRLEGFSHPACAGIAEQVKRRCPLLVARWGRAREVPGGVELELQSEEPIAELRRAMLCHIAYGRTVTESRCPLHVEGAQVLSERRGTRWVFQLLAQGRVEELRARVRGLLR